MIKVIRCLDCKSGITFTVNKGQIFNSTGDAICYNKVTKKYVGMCKSCYEKVLPKNKAQCKQC